MGFIDELKKIAHPYEDEEDDGYEDFDVSPRPVERRERAYDRAPRDSGYSGNYGGGYNSYSPPPAEDDRRGNKVVNIRAATQLQVVLVKPERFEDASSIADHLREKRTVVLNLESTNGEIARRLLDFLAGVSYAQEGKIKKVAISTYIITPYNVDILGDLIDELENNGLYF